MTDPNRPSPPSGLVLIDKSADRWMTSMKAVHLVKARLKLGGVRDPFRKRGLRVGHAGTLDPLASGLLIVLVGKATELCNTLMDGEKTYLTTIDLAHSSNTDDLEGQRTVNPIETPPSREAIDLILQSQFMGIIQQRPPAYSAIWVNAERAYDLARAGAPPTLPVRPISIHEIRIVEYAFPLLTLDIRCGKGTYIRSLARDIGIAATGLAGSLIALRRTAIGPYNVRDAMPVNALPDALLVEDLRPIVTR